MLIGLNGHKQAGKDTVYERAAHIMAGVIEVERVGFADKLYESAAASLGVSVEKLQEWKSNPEMVVHVGCWHSGEFEYQTERTIREYLQAYGTEAHRGVFGNDFWVDRAPISDHEGRLVFVTDCRFPNEARAIKWAGGSVVRVVGPPDVENSGDGHASEAPLPEYLIDAWIQNHVRDDNFRTLDAQIDTLLRVVLRGGA